MKYYIRCGELEKIVLADNPKEACEKSINLVNGETLGETFFVDERGYRGPTVYTKKGSITSIVPNRLKAEHSIALKDITHTVGED